MNSLLTCLVPIALMLQVAVVPGATPEELKKSFMLRYDDANARRDEQLKKLEAGYLGGLDRQHETAKSSGKLAAVIPIRDEIERVKAHLDPLPRLPDNTASEIKQMRSKYVELRNQVLKTHAETVTELFGKLEEVLKIQETELTKAGQIDDAIAAKQTRETLATTVGIDNLRELVKQGGLPGRAPPALRLRRYGDNLEVLVLPDRSGKVSMESPVQNVREETGEKKELGDTKAKVLGEFVGAKGYTADPYVSYHQIFNGKEAKGLTLADLTPEFRHEVETQKGMKLSYELGAKNPYAYLGEVLPPVSSKGSYQISAHYYIPKGNRNIPGYRFVHGAGHPVGEKLFEKSGKWTREEAIGTASVESKQLLLYLNLPTGKTVADAAGDYIVLGEIKVEHTRFSAFLQKKFGPNGAILESIDDPLKQPLYISNGAFVGK